MNDKTYFTPSPLGVEHVSSTQIMAYAVNGMEGVVLYLMGATVGIDAARAKLRMGDRLEIDCGYRLRQGVECREHTLIRSVQESSRQDMAIFVRKSALSVVPGEMYTYVISDTSVTVPHHDETTTEFIYQRLEQIVSVGILPTWKTQIVRAGREKELIRKISCEGCMVWGILNDPMQWTDIVSNLLKDGRISI